jgi:diketogulonate reductase-like aldo/keto reductase
MRGLGTFQPDPKAYPENSVKESVFAALRLGYRHIDTAFAYGNGSVERGVGEAVSESGIERSSIFIVSKL